MTQVRKLKIANPVLTNLRVDFEGMQVEDQYPQHLPDLFRGSSLLLTGRYHATSANVTVRVRGQVGDEQREYVYHYNLDQTGGHDFVPRLWATRKIGYLLNQIRLRGESKETIAQIVQLDPNNVGALRQMGQLYKKSGNNQQYGASLTKALEVAINDIDRKEIQNELGELLLGEGDSHRVVVRAEATRGLGSPRIAGVDHLNAR